jgi:opacity protein-like surface antigen
MNYLHAHPHATRVLLASVAALALLAAMSAAAASEPVTSDQFAPGWQSHARPLINMGFSRRGDQDRYYVPQTLPRGDYVLIKRNGDKAELINGYRFTVTSSNADQYIYLTPGYGEVEAVPIDDVPGLKARLGPAPLR